MMIAEWKCNRRRWDRTVNQQNRLWWETLRVRLLMLRRGGLYKWRPPLSAGGGFTVVIEGGFTVVFKTLTRFGRRLRIRVDKIAKIVLVVKIIRFWSKKVWSYTNGPILDTSCGFDLYVVNFNKLTILPSGTISTIKSFYQTIGTISTYLLFNFIEV